MNAGTLFLYIVLPAIFLVVATGNPENMRVKGVCIALAYLSLIVLDGWMCIANPTASPADKNDSPFGLVFILISLGFYPGGFWRLARPRKRRRSVIY